MDVTLQAIIDKNWFKIDSKTINTFRKNGISPKDTESFLAPVIEKQSAIALTKIPTELSEKIEPSLPFEQYAQFCTLQRQKTGRIGFTTLQNEIFKACDQQVSNILKERAIKQIHTTRDEFLARECTKDDLIETKGYNLKASLTKLPRYSSPPFQKTIEAINNEIKKGRISFRKHIPKSNIFK